MTKSEPSHTHTKTHAHMSPHVNSVHHHPHFLHIWQFIGFACVFGLAIAIVATLVWYFTKKTPDPGTKGAKWFEQAKHDPENEESTKVSNDPTD